MVGGAQKLTSLTTALFVLLAHLACACTPAGAASREPAAEANEPVAHECCRHSDAGQPRVPADDVPAEDHKPNCPHCAGGVATASQPAERGLTAAAVSHDPFAAVAAGSRAALPTPSESASLCFRFNSSPPLSPATLLGLRCALNL